VIPNRRTSCSLDHPTVPCHYNIAAWLRHCFAAVAVVGVADGFDEVAVAAVGGVSAVVAGGDAVAVVADVDLVAVAVVAEFSVDDDNC
jgi:hypothetical protein